MATEYEMSATTVSKTIQALLEAVGNTMVDHLEVLGGQSIDIGVKKTEEYLKMFKELQEEYNRPDRTVSPIEEEHTWLGMIGKQKNEKSSERLDDDNSEEEEEEEEKEEEVTQLETMGRETVSNGRSGVEMMDSTNKMDSVLLVKRKLEVERFKKRRRAISMIQRCELMEAAHETTENQPECFLDGEDSLITIWTAETEEKDEKTTTPQSPIRSDIEPPPPHSRNVTLRRGRNRKMLDEIQNEKKKK